MTDSSCDKYTFTLSDETKEYVSKQLNESEETRDKCLNEIKRWLCEDRPLMHARKDDRSILPFLRGCKFNIEKTKRKLTNYYTMKRDCPEWFRNRDPLLPEITELVKLGVFVPLLELTRENRLIIIIRTAAHDPNKHKQDDIFKAGKMILDIVCRENEYIQIYGVIAVFDMTGISFAHYKQLTPNIIKKAVFAWQNYHVRPQGLEFVNAPVYVNIGLNIFKQFMSEKLKKRVRVHFSGIETLPGIIDNDTLPEEYGGRGTSLKNLSTYWYDKLVANRHWFTEDEIYMTE